MPCEMASPSPHFGKIASTQIIEEYAHKEMTQTLMTLYPISHLSRSLKPNRLSYTFLQNSIQSKICYTSCEPNDYYYSSNFYRILNPILSL